MSRLKGVGCTSSGIIATAAASTAMKLIAVRTVPSIGLDQIAIAQ